MLNIILNEGEEEVLEDVAQLDVALEGEPRPGDLVEDFFQRGGRFGEGEPELVQAVEVIERLGGDPLLEEVEVAVPGEDLFEEGIPLGEDRTFFSLLFPFRGGSGTGLLEFERCPLELGVIRAGGSGQQLEEGFAPGELCVLDELLGFGEGAVGEESDPASLFGGFLPFL